MKRDEDQIARKVLAMNVYSGYYNLGGSPKKMDGFYERQ